MHLHLYFVSVKQRDFWRASRRTLLTYIPSFIFFSPISRAEVRQSSLVLCSLQLPLPRTCLSTYPTTNEELVYDATKAAIMLDHADADGVAATAPSVSEQELKPFLTKMVGNPSADTCRTLRFIMLGCEPNPPYGPNLHTAELLLDLIGEAAVESTSNTTTTSKSRPTATQRQDICWTITILIYDVQKGEYPTDSNEWNNCDGVLLPGSFSSAYDESSAWIACLASVIQQEIVAFQRPTMGICFGHQILAHSFDTGKAVKVPTGPRAGRFAMPMTRTGLDLLDWRHESDGEDNNKDNSDTSIGLYYTHGDMVAELPSVAVSLGGNEQVPIQAAAYFATPEDAAKVVQASADAATGNSEQQQQERPKPYAVSFQAHPEYASTRDLGYQTLTLNLDNMEQRGDLHREGRLSIGRDAQEHFETVQRDSVHIMLSTGRLLGWFPCS
jgi:GMP synthase-like glutamine amidotransferase